MVQLAGNLESLGGYQLNQVVPPGHVFDQRFLLLRGAAKDGMSANERNVFGN